MRVEILQELQDMERLAPEWQDLHESAVHRSIYNEPAFCLAWIKHFGAHAAMAPRVETDGVTPAERALPLLVAVRQNGRLDAVLPLRIVPSHIGSLAGKLRPGRLKKIPIRRLDGLINAHTEDTNILVRAGCENIAAKAMKQVASSKIWQGAHLGFFPSDSPMTQVLRSLPCSVAVKREKRDIRFLRFSSTHESYLAANPELHKKLRRAQGRLERDFGPVTLEWWTGQDAVEKGFPAFLEVDAMSWKAFAPEGEALAHSPLARGYYAELTERFAKMGRAHVWVLRLGGITAACEVTFESHGVLYAYKTSFKQMFATCGRRHPGLVLQALIIEHAWPRFSGIDFMSDWFQKEWVCETHPVESEKRLSLDPRRWLRVPIRSILHACLHG